MALNRVYDFKVTSVELTPLFANYAPENALPIHSA
jgi:hypothetical protein